jgi:hypothetical protein
MEEAEVFQTLFQTRGVQTIIFHHFSKITSQLLKIEFSFTNVELGFEKTFF